MLKKTNELALINGEIFPLHEASLPLSDRGFLFGHGVFETVLVRNGVLAFWEEHMARLALGCKDSLIATPDFATLKQDALKLCEQTQKLCAHPCDLRLRIIVTGGNGLYIPISRSPDGSLPKSNIYMICAPVDKTQTSPGGASVKLKTFLDVRPKELLHIKSTNYMWNIIALESARSAGYHDALLVKNTGEITEATTANFIWFDKNGRMYSTPDKGNTLAGTTKLVLARAMQRNGDPIIEKPLMVSDIANVAGAAITSSMRGLLPVSQIDDCMFDLNLLKDRFESLNKLILEELEKKI